MASSLEANLGQGHQIREKTWEVLVPQEAKIGTESWILGSYLKFKGEILGYLSNGSWRSSTFPRWSSVAS